MRDSWEEGMPSWVTPASGPRVTYFQLFYFFSQLSLQNKCSVLTPRLNSSEKLTLNPNPVSKQLIQHKSGQRRAERHGTFLHPRDSNSYANSDFYFRDSAGLCLLSTQTPSHVRGSRVLKSHMQWSEALFCQIRPFFMFAN